MRNSGLTIGRLLRALLSIFAAAAVLWGLSAATAEDDQPAQTYLYEFSGWAGPPIKFYFAKPEKAGADAPIVFVMHGVNRDADRYFAEWLPLAERYGFILVTPEFSDADFPKAARYNLGGVIDDKGVMSDRDSWAFSVIEPLFNALRSRLKLTATDYVLYGHSAGAQYAHRYALFGFGAHARMVIAANAGWYTFPGSGEWPYGPGGLPQGAFDVKTALAAPLVVLVGEDDTNPNHPSLRKTKAAKKQGRNRYDRAHAFYDAGRVLAEETGAEFNWSCVTAEGVDHDDAKAAPFAVALILGAAPEPGRDCVRGESVE